MLKYPRGTINGLCLQRLCCIQTTGQRDYVIHLARTPRPVNKEESDDTRKKNSSDQIVIKSVKDIQENWIADHAKHVSYSVLYKITPNPYFALYSSLF